MGSDSFIPPDSFVTIVSGLPRSGTSMMMQMLAAGGMPILTDSLRQPDEDNPRGYFEFEPVKRTREDPSWVSTAVGKAVKMVTVLLRDLPPDFEFRVILMRRDLDEVLQSQKTMLARRGKTGAGVSDEKLKELFFSELEGVSAWLGQQPNFRTLVVEHRLSLSDPVSVAASVAAFLDWPVDCLSIARAVDQTLYRKRLVRG